MNPFDLIDQRLSSIESLLATIANSTSFQQFIPTASDDLSLHETALELNLSDSRLYAIYKEILPSRKPSGKLIFSRKDVEEYKLRNRLTPISGYLADAKEGRIIPMTGS